MTSERFFFSPQPTSETNNKYTTNFYEALSRNVRVSNKGRPLSRSFDILRYTVSSDVMVLNWPEDVFFLRFGLFQLFLSLTSLLLFKAKGGKIIWICHNKDSHFKRYEPIRKLLRKFYIRFSDHIILHSEAAMNHFTRVKHKVHFTNHPVYFKSGIISEISDTETDIDVLIWGNIKPYKGLSEFISNYRKEGASFNITIIGKADKPYFDQLKNSLEGLNINIEDKFLIDKELDRYFQRSKIILLPYLDYDTFSSGALIHSLNSEKVVIGPAIGNFVDLSKWGACMIYNNYKDLFGIIKKLLNDKQYYSIELEKLRKGISQYYIANSWQQFIENLLSLLYKTKNQNVFSNETPGYTNKVYSNISR